MTAPELCSRDSRRPLCYALLLQLFGGGNVEILSDLSRSMSGTPLERQNPSKNPPKLLRSPFRGFCVQGSQKTLSKLLPLSRRDFVPLPIQGSPGPVQLWFVYGCHGTVQAVPVFGCDSSSKGAVFLIQNKFSKKVQFQFRSRFLRRFWQFWRFWRSGTTTI